MDKLRGSSIGLLTDPSMCLSAGSEPSCRMIPEIPDIIKTIHGIGYVFMAE
jgi:hypothetical protein